MKNYISSIKQWFDNNFVSHNKIVPLVVVTPKPKELTPEEIEALPVSCLVLGIIKSLEKNSKDWVISHSHSKMVSNVKNPVSIHFEYAMNYEESKTSLPYLIDLDFSPNKKEALLLKYAVEKLEKQRELEYQEERMKAFLSRTKYFETLGCPKPKNPPISKNK